MEKEIKKVQDYFKKKMLHKEFEIVKITEYNIYIKIDGIYKFSIWVANGPEKCSVYHAEYNFINLSFSEDEALNLYKTLSEQYKKNIRTIKQDKVQRLLKELESDIIN